MKSTAFPTKRIRKELDDLRVDIEVLSDMDAALEHYIAKGADIDAIPYFATLWPAAEALAQQLSDHRARLPGRRVLEIGTGLGYPSVIAAILGASVACEDFHPDSQPLLQRNAKLNGLAPFPFRIADWRHAAPTRRYEIVMGSDLVYEPESAAPVAAYVDQAVADDGWALITDPGREQISELEAQLWERGLSVETAVDGECFALMIRRQPRTSRRQV